MTGLCGCASRSSCPTNEEALAAVKKVMPVNFSAASIRDFSGIPGLCEVVLSVDNQPITVYMDKQSRYIFSGSIVDVRNQKNVTMEKQKAFKK